MRNIHLAKLVQELIRCEHGQNTSVNDILSKKYSIGGRIASRLTNGCLEKKDDISDIVNKLTPLLEKHETHMLFCAIIEGQKFEIETYTEKINELKKQQIGIPDFDATAQSIPSRKTRGLFIKKNEIPYLRDWIACQEYTGINKDICEYILAHYSLNPRNFNHALVVDKAMLPKIIQTINKSTKRDRKTYGENNEIIRFRISLVKLPTSEFYNQYVFFKVISNQ